MSSAQNETTLIHKYKFLEKYDTIPKELINTRNYKYKQAVQAERKDTKP